MTRKRTRESLGRTLHEPCFYCDGTGQLQSQDHDLPTRSCARSGASATRCPGYTIVVNAHPAVVDMLKRETRRRCDEARARFMRRSCSSRARSTTSSSST